MHQLIRILVWANGPDDAIGVAQGLFEGTNAGLVHPWGPYDYGKSLNRDDARWRESYPNSAENGAVPADSEEGQELIEKGWEQTVEEFEEAVDRIRWAVEVYSNEELMEDPTIEYGPEERKFSPRYEMHRAGQYKGPSLYLYTEHGGGIRRESNLDQVLEGEYWGSEDQDLYVVPFDVHY